MLKLILRPFVLKALTRYRQQNRKLREENRLLKDELGHALVKIKLLEQEKRSRNIRSFRE